MIVAVYTLFIIGFIVSVFKISNNWWDSLRIFIFCGEALLSTLLLTPKVKDILVKRYATRHTLPSDSDVSTKLK